MSQPTLTPAHRRFPSSVYGTGSEPDPRFTLANERTFLAWVRTSLALTAAGVALQAFGLGLEAHLRLAASILLIAAGIGTSVHAWFAWKHTERSMRLHQPLPAPRLALPIGLTLAASSILILLGVLLG